MLMSVSGHIKDLAPSQGDLPDHGDHHIHQITTITFRKLLSSKFFMTHARSLFSEKQFLHCSPSLPAVLQSLQDAAPEVADGWAETVCLQNESTAVVTRQQVAP